MLTAAQRRRWDGVRPSLSLDFTAGIDPRITFTRASTGTYVGANGLIATAGTDVPRIQYSSAGVCQGLLVEEARTNLALYASDLTNAVWVKVTVTTAMTATGPDGAANSATTVTSTAGNGTILQTIVSGSAARIQSCWIKRRTGTGTVNMTQDGTTWAAVTVTAGWTRVNIAAATLANPIVGLQIVTNGDAVDVAYMQQEVGSTVSSAIPPTTSASVTRAADVASMPVGSWFNAGQGTIIVAGTWPSAVGTSSVASFRAGSGGNNAAEVYAGGSNATFEVDSGGVTSALLNSAFSVSTAFKAAAAYATNDFAFTYNAGTVQKDTSGAVPVGIDTLWVGGINSSQKSNGTIQSIRYYPRRLPDTMLQALTR